MNPIIAMIVSRAFANASFSLLGVEEEVWGYRIKIASGGKTSTVLLVDGDPPEGEKGRVILLSGESGGGRGVPPHVLDELVSYAGVSVDDLVLLYRTGAATVKVKPPVTYRPKIREAVVPGQVVVELPLLYPLLYLEYTVRVRRGLFRKKTVQFRRYAIIDPSTLSFCRIRRGEGLVCDGVQRRVPDIPEMHYPAVRRVRGKNVTVDTFAGAGMGREAAEKVLEEIVASGLGEKVGRAVRVADPGTPEGVEDILSYHIDSEWCTVFPTSCLHRRGLRGLYERGVRLASVLFEPERVVFLLYPLIAFSYLKGGKYGILVLDPVGEGVNGYLTDRVRRLWDCIRVTPAFSSLFTQHSAGL